MQSREKRLALNTISSFVFQITTIICGFILPRLILKAFGSEVNGLVNSVTQFLGIISFLELGVGSVIQSSLYKPLADRDKDQISKVMVSGQKFFSKLAAILLVYVIVLMGIYPFIAKQDFGSVYTATMIGVISISSFAQYYFGIVNRLLLTADQKGYISYNVQTITLVLNAVACFILINIGASIHIVKLTTSLIYVLRPLSLFLYVQKHYQINRKIKYDIEPIRQKWNGVAQHISAVVLDGTDSVVLTVFAGLKAVSVYSVYYIVVSGVKQLLLSMTNGIQSLIGELWARQELEALRNFFGWVEWSLHTVTSLIFGITSVLIVPFVQVYTDGISDINYVQPLFAMLIVAANAGHCLRLPYNIMILAGGHYKQTQSNYIVAAVMNIVISIMAVNAWGLVGVAIETVAAMFYQTFWMAWYDSKNLICWPFAKFLKQLVIDVIIVMLMHLITRLPVISDFFQLQEIGYGAWVVLAVKVSSIGVLSSLCIDLIFYRAYVILVMKGVRNMFRRIIHVGGGYCKQVTLYMCLMEGRCAYAC